MQGVSANKLIPYSYYGGPEKANSILILQDNCQRILAHRLIMGVHTWAASDTQNVAIEFRSTAQRRWRDYSRLSHACQGFVHGNNRIQRINIAKHPLPPASIRQMVVLPYLRTVTCAYTHGGASSTRARASSTCRSSCSPIQSTRRSMFSRTSVYLFMNTREEANSELDGSGSELDGSGWACGRRSQCSWQ